MGIRMHLAVGYGLDLAQFPQLNRDRLGWSVLEETALFESWKADVIKFADTSGEITEKFGFHAQYSPPQTMDELQVYDNESGFADKLLLLPMNSRKDWQRYGDLLDAFVFEAGKNDLEFDMTPEWIAHPGTLYPYIGLMKAHPKVALGVEKYWVSCYRNHPEHKDALAWAPWHLWFWLRSVFQLTDEQTTQAFLSLRPTIYRHWG